MSLFSENIRLLRAQKGLSQQKLANALIITRAALSKYEEGRSEPPLEVLGRMARYFHVSIDVLLSVDLHRVPLESLLKMEDNRILLPITVDREGKDHIEIVPLKARAGYLQGYSDPEFVERLQTMSLPFLGQGKHRAFPIEGDSMPPHKAGSYIVGRYVEKLKDIRDGHTYVVLSRSEGIVYKRLFRKGRGQQSFEFRSDNPVYAPYEVKAADILELWEHVCSFCTKEYAPSDPGLFDLQDMFQSLRTEIRELKAGR